MENRNPADELIGLVRQIKKQESTCNVKIDPATYRIAKKWWAGSMKETIMRLVEVADLYLDERKTGVE